MRFLLTVLALFATAGLTHASCANGSCATSNAGMAAPGLRAVILAPITVLHHSASALRQRDGILAPRTRSVAATTSFSSTSQTATSTQTVTNSQQTGFQETRRFRRR